MLRIALIIAISIYFICIYILLKRKKLNLKYTLIWIFSGIVMIVVVAFPKTFTTIINKIGIIDSTNGIFGICIFLIILILMSITSIVSTTNEKNKKLIQKCALLEKRLREVEKNIYDKKNKTKE